MNRRRLLALLVVALVAVLVVRQLLWSDERDIQRRLDMLAEAASFGAGETDIVRLARAAKLGAFFVEDVMIRNDVSSFVGGRRAVSGMALQGAALYGGMTVSFSDVEISLADPITATVYLTVAISAENPEVGSPEPRQVNATLSKSTGEWLVSRAEVLRTLDPQSPSTQ